MDPDWTSTPPGPLYGKRIVRAWIGKLEAVDEYTKKEYDDTPYYYIELETGEVFRFVANYGGWSGKSEDEYPRMIHLQASVKNKDNQPLSARFVSYTGKSVELLPGAKRTPRDEHA